jgi:hypothetical protein
MGPKCSSIIHIGYVNIPLLFSHCQNDELVKIRWPNSSFDLSCNILMIGRSLEY